MWCILSDQLNHSLCLVLSGFTAIKLILYLCCVPCHLTYVSILTARDAVVGLLPTNRLECICKNPHRVGISFVPECLQVISSGAEFDHQLIGSVPDLGSLAEDALTPSIWAPNASMPLRCDLVNDDWFDFQIYCSYFLMMPVSRFHHTRVKLKLVQSLPPPVFFPYSTGDQKWTVALLKLLDDMNAPDYALKAILTWARSAICRGLLPFNLRMGRRVAEMWSDCL